MDNNTSSFSSAGEISTLLKALTTQFGDAKLHDALHYATRNGSLFEGKFSVLLPSGDVLDVNNVDIPGHETKVPLQDEFFVSKSLLDAQTLAACGIVLIEQIPNVRQGELRNVFTVLMHDKDVFMMASPLEEAETESAPEKTETLSGIFDEVDDFIARVDIRSTEIFNRLAKTWAEEAPKVESAITNVAKRIWSDITR